MFDRLPDLLQELVYARGPSGQEDEVRSICLRELEPLCDEVHTDASGNVVGLIRGGDADSGPVVRVMAHMDELAMIVKPSSLQSGMPEQFNAQIPTRPEHWPVLPSHCTLAGSSAG